MDHSLEITPEIISFLQQNLPVEMTGVPLDVALTAIENAQQLLGIPLSEESLRRLMSVLENALYEMNYIAQVIRGELVILPYPVQHVDPTGEVVKFDSHVFVTGDSKHFALSVAASAGFFH